MTLRVMPPSIADALLTQPERLDALVRFAERHLREQLADGRRVLEAMA
jgi:hypothetical protein